MMRCGRGRVTGLVLGLMLLLAAGARGETPVPGALPNPFFAMDTGTRDATHQTPESQVALLAELGYAGIGPEYHNMSHPAEMLAAVDKHGLKIFAVYMPLNIDAGKAAIGPQFRAALQALKGRGTVLWVNANSNKYKPSAVEGDAAAVPALQELADLAKPAGLKIALYPHAGAWLERVEDGVRVIEKAGRDNIGVTFNLCHWLRVDGKDLDATLHAAGSHLYMVTISGADVGGRDWHQLIQPLDAGTYDVSQVLQALIKINYQGPIGLQHYGIGGAVRQNLQRSMDGWRKISAKATGTAEVVK